MGGHVFLILCPLFEREKENNKLRWLERWGRLEGVDGEKEYDQNIIYEIIKANKYKSIEIKH